MQRKNPVTRAVKEFIRQVGEPTAEAVIEYIKNQGFSVIFYTHEKNEDLLKVYKALEYSKSFNNFTVFGKTAKAVFILRTLSAQDKYIALLHETAHIVMGHILENADISNPRLNEVEAEAFTYEVLYRRSGIFY